MRITTWNVNGLRAAIRKGFADHLEILQPDVLLLQEIRVRPDQLAAEWAAPEGWHVWWHPAEKAGYAGVAVWSRLPFEVVATGLNADDPEGRVLRVKTVGVSTGKPCEFVSVYLPSGSSGEPRQLIKNAWLDEFLPWSQPLARKRTPVVMAGDLNIAHTPSDIFYAKGNEKNSGFLPHEREWFGTLLESGWRDIVREQFPGEQGPYTWWSNRGKARELDRGWRIDYCLANAAAGKLVQSAHVHRDGGLTVSDHAPVSIDLDL